MADRSDEADWAVQVRSKAKHAARMSASRQERIAAEEALLVQRWLSDAKREAERLRIPLNEYLEDIGLEEFVS